MEKSKLSFLLCFMFLVIVLNAQNQPSITRIPDKATIGLGMGLDYGGFGANFLYYPQKNIGLFVGGGYAIVDFGFNGGIKLRLVSDKPSAKISPYLLAMYGYNAVIGVSNATEYNKIFYGPSLGFGFDFSRPEKRGYWAVALIIPLRGSEVNTYIDDLKDNHGVTFKNDLLPIAVSIGYRFILK
jgi:hypothetical protein